MSRTPSMTPQEAEQAILLETGRDKGHVFVTSKVRPFVIKWLTAHGLPASFANRLGNAELAYAFNYLNPITGKAGYSLDDLKERAAAAGDRDDDAVAPAPAWRDPANALEQAIRDIAAGVASRPSIDADQVRAIVQQELQGAAPRVVEIRQGGAVIAKLEERTHPLFERVLRLVSCGANVLLVGPAGCGKTHLCEQVAKALNAAYGAIHGSAGASESALTGWLLPGDGGVFEYMPAPFVTLYESGESLFLFDELDAFDPNMLLVANGALANGHIHVPHRKGCPTVKRGTNARIVATANTYGTGANPMYAGRSPLDAATLDRFVVVTVDYDKGLEEAIALAGGLTAPKMTELWALRDRVREAQLRRTISTRAFQKAGIMRAAGDSWRTIMTTLVEGWTKDEKGKVGL